MSLELSVYCDRAKLPTAQQWSKAMKKDGFDVSFIRGLNWKKPDGAVKLNGDETHFELSLFPNDPDEDPPTPAAKFDSLVAFRFGSTGGEAALLAAAALSRIAKGYLYDPDMDAPLKDADAVAEAKRMLAPAPKGAKKRFESSWDDLTKGAKWVAAAEMELRIHVHPAYRHNSSVSRANLIEFVRRDEKTGLFLSQNFVRKTTLGEDEYHQCFALTLEKLSEGSGMLSLLVAGPRWDHNHTVFFQMAKDLKAGFKSSGLSAHKSKPYFDTTNFKRLVHNAKAAEQYLLPHYVKVLKRNAQRLIELFTLAQWLFAKVPPKTKAPKPLQVAKAAGIEAGMFNHHRFDCINIDAQSIGDAKRFAKVPAKIRDAMIVGHNIDDLWAVRDRLPEIIETLKRLSGKQR
jgi:hypothetical protein